MNSSKLRLVALLATLLISILSVSGDTWTSPWFYAYIPGGYSGNADAYINSSGDELELGAWIESGNWTGQGSLGYHFPTKVGEPQWSHWEVYNVDRISYFYPLNVEPYRNTCVAYGYLIDADVTTEAYVQQ